jgi:hypothetical protein
VSETAAAPPRLSRLVALLRQAAGILVGGLLASLVWVFFLQEGVERGWTTVDWVRPLGELLGAGPDEAARLGWYASMVAWVALALVLVPAARLVGGSLWRRTLAVAAVPFLLWGLLFMGLVDAREPEWAAGLLGWESGWEAAAMALAGSVFSTVLLLRVHDLLSGTTWWEPKEHSLEASLAALAAPSLELPEQRPEQGGERPGA